MGQSLAVTHSSSTHVLAICHSGNPVPSSQDGTLSHLGPSYLQEAGNSVYAYEMTVPPKPCLMKTQTLHLYNENPVSPPGPQSGPESHTAQTRRKSKPTEMAPCPLFQQSDWKITHQKPKAWINSMCWLVGIFFFFSQITVNWSKLLPSNISGLCSSETFFLVCRVIYFAK